MSAHTQGSHARDDATHHAANDHVDDHAADGHGDDDHDDHGEPPPPEPASPAWLPLLGGALFLLALIAFLVVSSDDADASPDAAVAAGEPQAEEAAEPSPAAAPNGRRPTEPVNVRRLAPGEPPRPDPR